MKRTAISILSMIIAVSLSSAAFAGTRITMKNGRTFVVGDCQDTKRSLICEMYGGTIELDKSDIESIEGVKYTPGQSDDSGPTEESAPAEGKPETSGQKKQEGGALQPESQDGRVVRGLSPEQARRLAQINERKAAMKTERDNLIEERARLQEDVKNAGTIRDQALFNSLRSRIADLDVRINNFNDETRKLNEEEAGLSAAGRQQ